MTAEKEHTLAEIAVLKNEIAHIQKDIEKLQSKKKEKAPDCENVNLTVPKKYIIYVIIIIVLALVGADSDTITKLMKK